MLLVPGTVNGRKPQSRDWKFPIATNGAFNLDVVVVDFFSVGARRLGSQRRFLSQWHRVWWPRFGAPHPTERPVDIATRDYNRTTGDVFKVEHSMTVLVHERHHVENYLRFVRAEPLEMTGQGCELSVDMANDAGKLSFGLAPVEDGHVVPSLRELSNDVWTDEARSTEDHDSHGATYRASVMTRRSKAHPA